MKSWLTGGLVVLTLLYPVVVYYGLGHVSPRALGLLLATLVGLRVLLARGLWRQRWHSLLPFLLPVGVTTVLLLIFNTPTLVLLAPLLINCAFLLAFAVTLVRPPSMAERFARLQEPALPPQAVAYCRRVTLVWCGFFVFNGAISLATVAHYWRTAELGPWTLYNGLLCYLAMGVLAGVEYLVRRRVRAAHDRLQQELESHG